MSIGTGDGSIRDVAVAQKLILVGILLSIGVYAISAATKQSSPGLQPLILLVYAGVVALQLYGCYRLASGLGFGTGLIVLCLVLMFIPCVSLITLVVLNQKATTVLRNAGLKVGLLGVSLSEVP